MSKCDEKSHPHIFKSEEEKGGIPSGHGLRAGGRTGASSLSSSPTLAATGSAPLLRNDVLTSVSTPYNTALVLTKSTQYMPTKTYITEVLDRFYPILPSIPQVMQRRV